MNWMDLFMRGSNGFTLMEILLALMVLAVLSVLLSSGLRSMIGISDRVQNRADTIRALNSALLIMSDDVKQTVDRPVKNAANQDVPAFVGNAREFWLTHGGVMDPTAESVQSNLTRSHYRISGHQLIKEESLVLDQAKEMKWPSRVLLNEVEDGRFEYLNQEKYWQSEWRNTNAKETLPRAVRFRARVRGLGEVTQWMLVQVSVVSN